jgi:hypothetical protein
MEASMKYAVPAFLLIFAATFLDAAATTRSYKARSSFAHANPCPSTGKASTRCPGYVIDHIIPLDCGGLDDPSNMQWQTIAEAKAKDKWERNGPECKHRTHGVIHDDQ